MHTKKWFIWVLLIVLMICVLTTAAFFWDTILLYTAPKAVLSAALTRLYSQLEVRFSGCPAAVLAKYFDPEGRYTAHIQADTGNVLLGDIRYDMTVQTDAASHRLCAQGTAGTSDHDLALSMYLDDSFLAVSSEDLVQGDWYGITYDSFASDIRCIPLLSHVLSESIIRKWDASLRDIQAMMRKDYVIPEFSGLSDKEMQTLLAGILMLQGKVSADQIKTGDAWTECRRIDYTVSAEQLPGILPQEGGRFSLSFYLHEKSVIRIDFEYLSEPDRVNGEIHFGVNPASEAISLVLNREKNGSSSDIRISVSTRNTEGEYIENWIIQKDGIQTAFHYDWYPMSGDLLVSWNNGTSVTLNLAETEAGIRLYTEDCAELLEALNGKECAQIPKQCTITLQKGSGLVTPTYKNLDQWSLDDFWRLLEGAGALLGIKVN